MHKKTATLSPRVNPAVKQQAEGVQKQLGISMTTAVEMCLKQISLTSGIPFLISLPKAPSSVSMDAMTADEFRSALQAGYDDMLDGKRTNASTVFAAFRESRK